MTRFLRFLLLLLLSTTTLLPHHAISIDSLVEERPIHNNIRRRAGADDYQEWYDYLEQFTEANNNTIVGGDNANRYPWFVHFASKVCGGTLISPTRVLTSATCLKLTGVPSLVRVGATNARNGILAPVGCAKTHPDYTLDPQTIYADVAVLKLASAVEGVDPVALNMDLTYPAADGQQLTALGMGYTETNGDGGLASRLQELDLDYIPIGECQSQYQSTSIIRSGLHLCTEARKKKGLCTGDSGGPLLDRASSPPRQVGIASFTYGPCGSQNVPDVFASVAFYYAWIQTQLVDSRCDGEPTNTPSASQSPSSMPSREPSSDPSSMPSLSQSPSSMPSISLAPSSMPSISPSESPSASASPASLAPSVSIEPSNTPSAVPTNTLAPTATPGKSVAASYAIAVDVFSAMADTVGAMMEFTGGVLQWKRDWFKDNVVNKKDNKNKNDNDN